jgi:hypothetical protein
MFAVSTAVAMALSARVDPLYQVPNPEYLATFNLVVISLFIYIILYYFVRKSDQLFRQADGLLRNVLPNEIAERLKVSGEMIADEFESASILFADVSGFTPMAAGLEPGQVVTLLNEIFTSFDELVEIRGLEKIKTIGDAYIVAAGSRCPVTTMPGPSVISPWPCSPCARPHHRWPPHRNEDRDRLRPGDGGDHRSEEVQLRPVGRHGESGQQDGEHRGSRQCPAHHVYLFPGPALVGVPATGHHRG